MADPKEIEVRELFAAAKKCFSEGKSKRAVNHLQAAAGLMIQLAEGNYGTDCEYWKIRARSVLDLIASQKVGASKPIQKVAAGEADNSQSPLELVGDAGICFDDVAGLQNAKEAVYRRLIRPARDPDGAMRWKQAVGGALLLYGPPGCGKTFFAKAIAGEMGLPFFEVKASSLLSKWQGDSEKNVAQMFHDLAEYDQAVLYMDEVEGLLGRRDQSRGVYAARVVSEFLAAFDGVNTRKDGLFFLGATNFPEKLDPGMTRHGRFGAPVYIGLPNAAARVVILAQEMAGLPVSADLNVEDVACQLERYSGADLNALCQRAIDLARDREDRTSELGKLNRDDFSVAAAEVLPSVSEKELKRYSEYR